jgi:hypothetical protein
MAVIILATGSALAQDVTGDWQGTLKVGSTALRLVLHLSKDKKGELRGAIDSIDQPGGVGLPLTSATFHAPELRLSLEGIMATYEGRMNLAGAIEGTWSQGQAIPLTWERKIVTPAKPVNTAALAGHWQGDLDLGLAALYLIVHIESAHGKLKAFLESPDQGGATVAADRAAIEDGYLTVKWDSLDAVYRARIDSDPDTLDGSFTQRGMPGALKLRRVRNREETVRRRPQMPVKPYPYRSEDVQYRNANASGNVTLAGTLTIPQGPGPFPAAILIAGSGDLDRDESMDGHKPFLVLADYLTRKGFAVLRADKRGAGKSGGESDSALTTDYASDVAAGVAFLRARPEVDGKKIGLIGHSEGGVIAPLVAAKDRGIAFLVLMAGTGVTGEELAAEQTQSHMEMAGVDAAEAAKSGEATREIVAALNHSKNAIEMKKELMAKPGNTYTEGMIDALVARFEAPWVRAFLAIDPRVALRSVVAPVLAINGSKDRQVPAGPNLAGIRAALEEGKNPHFEVAEIAGLNHLFQTAETGAPREYGHIEETIAPAALERIAAWMTKMTGGE